MDKLVGLVLLISACSMYIIRYLVFVQSGGVFRYLQFDWR